MTTGSTTGSDDPAFAALAGVPLFAGISAGSLANIESFAFRKTFQPGELIVEENHTGNGMYVVLSGSVEVVRGLAGERPQRITVLGPGEVFGEMALLGDWKRTASVRAIEETECLGLDRWVFLAHLQREPEIAIRMLHVLAGRLAALDQAVFG